MTTAAFTPVTVQRMREDASNFTAIAKLIDNPAEVWSNKLYQGHYHIARFMGRGVIHTSDPQTFQDVLLTHQAAFPKSEVEHRLLSGATGDGLLTSEGAHWKSQRKAASPAFRHDRLMALLPSMDAAGARVAQALAKQSGETDVLPFMIDATFEIIANTLLSGDEDAFDSARVAKDVALFLEDLGKMDLFDFIPPLANLPRPWGARGRAAVRRLRADADTAVRARRASASPKADLLDLLMSATDKETGDGLSDLELRDNIITFIGAGHETTSLALTWTLYLLANAPDWQDNLHKEAKAVCGDGPVEATHIDALPLHEWVIREAMRLYPPAAAMARSAAEDISLTNLDVKKNDQIILAIYPMHRHEKLWDHPELFDPERFSPERSEGRHRFQYIPFSGGPRICIGMRFAMMEAIAILAHIVRRAEFAPHPTFTPYPKSRITLRPQGGMKLMVKARE